MKVLQIIGTCIKFIVTGIIIIGTELTIAWNEIRGVNDLSSAGQTIPLALGVAIVARVLYVRFLKRRGERPTPMGNIGRWFRVESWKPERPRPGPVHGYDVGPHDLGAV